MGKYECESEGCDRDSWAAPGPQRSSAPRSGYSLTSDGLACEKRESRAASVSCPAGSSQYSLGMGGAWGCRRDLGAASTSYSCAQGVLVTVTNGFQGGKACKVTSSSTESKNASAKCDPRGTPPSCRYTATVLVRQSQSASSSCSPSGSPPTCRYTAPVLVRQSQSASSSCSPSGSPPTCRYTSLVSTRESKSASRYCSPSGTPPSCRHSVKQSSSATYHYIPGIGGYYYCSSGWTLSGSTCYRYVTSYGSLRYSCPSGWTLSGGTCYRYLSSRVTRYGSLSYSCSSGWTLSGSTCYRYLSSTVTRYGTLSYSCSSDWTLSGSTCYRYSSSTVTRYGTLSYSCSSGWTLSGSKCTRTTTSVRYVSPSSSLSCSSGTLSGGKCWSYPAKVKSCPNGWTLSSGSCTRTLTASPIYTYSCPQGSTLRGTRCYVTPTTTTTTTTSTTTTTTAATTTTTATATSSTTTTMRSITTTTTITTATTASSTTTTSTAASTTTTSSTTTIASTTTTVESAGASPQVGTTTTAASNCALGWFLSAVLNVCASFPGAPQRVAVIPASGSLKVYWQGTTESGKQRDSNGVESDLPLISYTVEWREKGALAWDPVSSMSVPAATGAAASSGGFYTRSITGLTDKKVYEVRVSAVNEAYYSTPSSRPVVGMPVTRDSGGWQPYDLPEPEGAFLNEKTRRGEPLTICTTVMDFAGPITTAVNHLNNTLRQANVFGNVFEFSGSASSLADCRELAHGSKVAKIDPNNSFDIIFSDYRCPEGSTDSDGNACPVNVRNCAGQGCSPITRCTAANRDTNLACAETVTRCSPTAAGCTWPNFSTWPGKTQDWVPRPVDGSAIQIVSEVFPGLFEHELGHLLGLDDYGHECAWEEVVSSAGVRRPGRSVYKVPSLYSYKDGPRSWQALIDDPSKYNSDYFNCRSDTLTTKDKKDLSSIYYQRAFEGSSYTVFQVAGPEGRRFWRFQIAVPPSDPMPSNLLRRVANVCDAEWGKAGGRWTYVYNAYAWIIMHRAKGSTGAWQPLRNDTAGTTRLDDGELVVIRPSDFDSPKKYDSGNPPEELLEYIYPTTTPSTRPQDCWYLAVNVDLTEPAYANIRSHEFVVVGLTRGDPLVNASNLDGTSRSNILLDLGDGAKQWTLGEPSAVMTFSGTS